MTGQEIALDIEKFPTLLAIVETPNEIQRNGRGRIEKALTDLNQGLVAGEIPNVDYVNAKDTLGRYFDRAFRIQVSDVYLNQEPEERKDAKEVHEIYYASAYLHLLGSLEKKARKAPEESPTAAGALALVNEFRPIAEALAAAKKIAVKKQSKPQEERNAPYVPPPAARPAVDMTRRMLERITREDFEGLVERMSQRFQARLNRFKSEYERIGKPPRRHRYFAEGDPMQSLLMRCVDFEDSTMSSPIRFKEGADELLAKEARNIAEMMREPFVLKTISKVAPIFEAKPELKDIAILGRGVDIEGFNARLRFIFEDDSAFTLQNSAVLSVSSRGTPYVRFPSTFHDVVMPDGSALAEPSEQRMNEEFAQADAPAPGMC